MFFELPHIVTQQLDLVLLQLHAKLTRTQSNALANGQLHIRTRRYKGFGALKCTEQLQKLSTIIAEHIKDSSR
eukprot:767675-Karenia_brevis.AAC.1